MLRDAAIAALSLLGVGNTALVAALTVAMLRVKPESADPVPGRTS